MAKNDNNLPPVGGPPKSRTGRSADAPPELPNPGAMQATLPAAAVSMQPVSTDHGVQAVSLMVQDKLTGGLVPLQWDSGNGGLAITLSAGFPHSALSGLTTGDDHTQYALLTGRAGGQTLKGSTVTGEKLTLRGNSIDADGGLIDVRRTLITDNSANASTAGELARNGTILTWHDGSAARYVILSTSLAPSDNNILQYSAGSGAWRAQTSLNVSGGGTGIITTTAYGVLCGGTTATGAFQNAGAGLSAQLLISQGAAALPTWNTLSGDATISAAGALTVANLAITNAKIANATIDLTTKVTGNLPVTNGGTGLATLTTAYGVVCAGTVATGNLQNAGAGTSAQIFISQGAAALPTWNSVSGDITITNAGVTAIGALKVTNAMIAAATIDLAAKVTGLLPLANGGTAANLTANNGGIIYSNASAFAVLGGTATANKPLISGSSTSPSWAAYTIPTALAIGDVIYADTTTSLARLADVAAGSYLRSGGVTTAPVWSSITLPNTAAIGDIWYASTTGAISALADIATGNALISGGVSTAPSWGKIGLTTHVSGSLPEANGGTNQSTYSQGDILYASASNTLSKRALGLAGQVLSCSTTVPQYTYVPLVYKTVTFTANAYTAVQADANALIGVTAGSTADQTVTLPAANTVGAGYTIAVQKVDSGTKAVIIACNAAVKIGAQGASGQYTYMVLTSTGSGNSWIVVACDDWMQSSYTGFTWTATSTQYGDATGNSIILSPGEWDISVNAEANGTGYTAGIIGIGTASGNSGTGLVTGDSQAYLPIGTAANNGSASIPTYRVSITTATTYYLKMNFTYSVAPTVYGRISARRIR